MFANEWMIRFNESLALRRLNAGGSTTDSYQQAPPSSGERIILQ